MSRLGLGFALALATFGCAEERPPIDRVQPNALKKSFFVGEDKLDTKDDPEFHYRATLVDTGYGAQQDGLFTSTYAMPVSRIKWEITENALIARLAYQRIDDTDGKEGTQKGKEGQVVAAFPITSHFDIRRAYNSITGEEQNVVEENASDRPWYERDYFRVDWSKNQVSDAYDFDTLSMLGVIGGVKYEPMQYYVNDPTNPDAPVFDDGYFDITQKVYATPQMIELPARFGGGSIPACFLDADISGGTSPIANCNPQELKLRLSFRQVQDTDYEAQDWDGVRFQAFGAFTLNFNGRMGYTRPYGIVDDKTHRFIERYNIWQKSHYYDAGGHPVVCGTPDTEAASTSDNNNDGTIDACEAVTAATGVGGSRCDVYAKKCTLPYQARADKPVVWHFTYALPEYETDKAVLDQIKSEAENLFEPTDWATQEWDVAIRGARTAARLVECRRTGGGEACDAKFPVWNGQMDDQEDLVRLAREVNACRRAQNGWTASSPGFAACNAVADQKGGQWGASPAVIAAAKQENAVILCHNPVASNDHPLCAGSFKPGTSADHQRVRVGDLRYNVVNTINTPQVPSAWGIMVDAKDPLTGETVAASINIWNHVTDIASQNAVDVIRYINGELTTKDITDGKFIKDWVLANEGLAGGSRTAPPLSKEEVVQRLNSATSGKNIEDIRKSFDSYISGKAAPISDLQAQRLKSAKQMAKDVRATADITQSTNAARLQARMERARGSDFEAQLINKPALEAIGLNANSAGESGGDLAREFASPLRRNNEALNMRIRQARQMAMAERGACIIEAAPEFSGIIGLARIMQQKFPDDGSGQARIERMRKYIARKYQYGVLIHEMGHSFGERHNFLSSYDAYNFRPQYWQLRTKNGAVTGACNGPQDPEGAANCVGPRYFDPITDEETNGLLWMWQQSSVMDYPGDITLDTLGLGAYDFAAARMFYGETTSVFRGDASIPGNDINANWVLDDDKDGYSNAAEQLVGTDPADPKSKKKLTAEEKAQADKSSGIVQDLSDRMDSFGGILGLRTGDAHYTQHQAKFNVIQGGDLCTDVNPQDFKPSTWNDAVDGPYHETLDGRFVSVDGTFKRCRQQPVDYAHWTDLRPVNSSNDAQTVIGDNPPAADPAGRLRVPYPFASDNWADLGNVSVYRHDQGADVYEQFMFLMGAAENRHILDHYRRNRTTFAIRPAMSRDFDRYTGKIMNSVKGLGLYRNIYAQDGLADGWSSIAGSGFLADNVIAASLAMDHFSRQLTRPQDGDHFLYSRSDIWSDAENETPVFRSNSDTFIISPNTLAQIPGKNPSRVFIPNGTSGYQDNGFTAVSFGGRPIENGLDRTKGDYSSSYTLNVGSYYDKINAIMALTESQDNFISASRGDFVDARYRAVSIADVFPEGFERLMGAALTDDASLLGPRIEGSAKQFPKADAETTAEQLEAYADFCSKSSNTCVTGEDGNPYPSRPMAWTSWWPASGPLSCWTANGSQLCYHYDENGNLNKDDFGNAPPDSSIAIDPEVGWEVQKYIIAWTYLYLPENNRTDWFERMRIYRSYDLPDIQGAVVKWRDPGTGTYYVAKSYGRENLAGRDLEKGLAARVLQHCNELTAKAYEVESVDAATGELTLKLDENGQPIPRVYSAVFGDLDRNPYINDLKRYKSVPDFMWQAAMSYGLTEGASPKGVY